jgi:hypothetical protein
VVGVRYDPDPTPDGEIQLTYEQFAEGFKHVEDAGFRWERSAEDAWPHFKGWRINYEQTAYALARRVDAVPVKWSGPRDWPFEEMSPIRPPHRRPDAPDVPFPGA